MKKISAICCFWAFVLATASAHAATADLQDCILRSFLTSFGADGTLDTWEVESTLSTEKAASWQACFQYAVFVAGKASHFRYRIVHFRPAARRVRPPANDEKQ